MPSRLPACSGPLHLSDSGQPAVPRHLLPSVFLPLASLRISVPWRTAPVLQQISVPWRTAPVLQQHTATPYKRVPQARKLGSGQRFWKPEQTRQPAVWSRSSTQTAAEASVSVCSSRLAVSNPSFWHHSTCISARGLVRRPLIPARPASTVRSPVLPIPVVRTSSTAGATESSTLHCLRLRGVPLLPIVFRIAHWCKIAPDRVQRNVRGYTHGQLSLAPDRERSLAPDRERSLAPDRERSLAPDRERSLAPTCRYPNRFLSCASTPYARLARESDCSRSSPDSSVNCSLETKVLPTTVRLAGGRVSRTRDPTQVACLAAPTHESHPNGSTRASGRQMSFPPDGVVLRKLTPAAGAVASWLNFSAVGGH